MTTPRVPDAWVRRCDQCGDAFEAPRVGRPPERCSVECRRAVRARRQRNRQRELASAWNELMALRNAADAA